MTIKGLLLIAGSLGIGMIAADAASAASPAYCALYSREYAIDSVQPTAAPGMLQSVQDQAYYRCLNMDEDPPLPQKSAYFGTKLPATSTVTASTAATGGAASTGGTVIDSGTIVPPIPRPAPAAAPKTVVTASAPKSTAPAESRGGGRQPWTEEWMAYCAKYFPNSWDPKTGTILHYGSDTRELCK